MNRISFPPDLRKKILIRDNFTCQKCGFQDFNGQDLEIHHKSMCVDGEDSEEKNLLVLCSICHHYSPDKVSEFERYLNERVDGKILDTFRKSERSISKRTKKGMIALFNKGKIVTKAPKGYNLINKMLIIDSEQAKIVQEIYQEFLNSDISLTQLSKKYNLSVNGLKKVLTNQTYLGKVKFSGEICQGKHAPLLSQEIFNKVQEKLKNKKKDN